MQFKKKLFNVGRRNYALKNTAIVVNYYLNITDYIKAWIYRVSKTKKKLIKYS